MEESSRNLLKPGQMLGPYRVESLIGKGGMGEVYRATDTRLGRPVAIKISGREFSDRFEREAKAISSLNHPNICTLYDVGPNYLVMELVEGSTLSSVVKQGPMPLEAALQHAVQIAGALSAAHAKGIVHRDLKPANIILTANGVKVLDFGLAKFGLKPAGGGSSEIETRTEPITEHGAILGTIHYMSPEQAEGKETDERSDIFSFGVVLYEMLTGRHAFDGDSTTAILAAILKDQQPPIHQFQPAVPRSLDRVVRKCLEKKPADRWHSAYDLKQTLELIDPSGPTSGSTSSTASQPVVALPARRRWLWPATAAGVIAAGAALALWAPWRKPVPTQAVRFEVGPSDNVTFIDNASMAVSPDGRWMVFPARDAGGVRHYWVRSLDGVEVRPLPDTDEQAPAAWSYDSRWVVFADKGKLKKVDIQGGEPQNICDFPGLLSGADWNQDGIIIAAAAFGQGPGPIFRVAASGGQAAPITALAPGEASHSWPQFLPDGKHFLYFRASNDAAKRGVYIGSINAKPNEQKMQRLLATNRQAFYAAAPGGGAGYLLFQRQSTLMAQPFDPYKMTLSGETQAVVDGVDSFGASNHGLFSVSKTGTLVYRASPGSQEILTWFDLQGKPIGTLGDPGNYGVIRISPDGSRVAVPKGPAGSRDIWILDVARNTATQLTFDPAQDGLPVWSPDSKTIVFTSNRGGHFDLYIKPADGSSEEKLLFKSNEPKQPAQFTKDGRFLLFLGPNRSISVLPFPGGANPIVLMQTSGGGGMPQVSPDGRWLAYADEGNPLSAIFVRPFTPEAPAGSGAKWRVSQGDGTSPIWRPDGKALLYVGGSMSEMMEVDIDAGKEFRTGAARALFPVPTDAGGWALAPDGKRFLFAVPPGKGHVIPFTVVLNWTAGLKK